ncbi:MAG: Lrp/AsnC family transcriptional regulator [Burkholderiales bacterium]|nr:Lrp/AsnC family transcriptional regulator [Burkholderiales bacterium]MCE7877086.1 Lrp/AsnC family transcriptional regulator [Betaproteobacteria bacterium PRO3]
MSGLADPVDRAIVNALQGDFPLCERPFAAAAEALRITEDDLIARIDRMLADGTLTRFGPLYDAARFGGAFTLAAMSVPEADFDRVAGIVNAFPEVAHNYARDHRLNLWFVVATPAPEDLDRVVGRIESATGLPVLAFPKEREYFVELRLEA